MDNIRLALAVICVAVLIHIIVAISNRPETCKTLAEANQYPSICEGEDK